MDSDNYRKRELDFMFQEIKDQLNRIEDQTTAHNHRLSKVERYLLVVGCVSGTILVMNGSALFTFIKAII